MTCPLLNLKYICLSGLYSGFPADIYFCRQPGGVFMCLNPADGNGPNSHFIFAAFETFV